MAVTKTLPELLYGKQELMDRFGRYDVSMDEISSYIDSLPWHSIRVPHSRDNISHVVRESKALGRFTFTWSIDSGVIEVKAINPMDLAYFKLKYGH